MDDRTVIPGLESSLKFRGRRVKRLRWEREIRKGGVEEGPPLNR